MPSFCHWLCSFIVSISSLSFLKYPMPCITTHFLYFWAKEYTRETRWLRVEITSVFTASPSSADGEHNQQSCSVVMCSLYSFASVPTPGVVLYWEIEDNLTKTKPSGATVSYTTHQPSGRAGRNSTVFWSLGNVTSANKSSHIHLRISGTSVLRYCSSLWWPIVLLASCIRFALKFGCEKTCW